MNPANQSVDQSQSFSNHRRKTKTELKQETIAKNMEKRDNAGKLICTATMNRAELGIGVIAASVIPIGTVVSEYKGLSTSMNVI